MILCSVNIIWHFCCYFLHFQLSTLKSGTNDDDDDNDNDNGEWDGKYKGN